MARRLLLLCLILTVWLSSSDAGAAQFLEVRRSAVVYDKASKDSEKVANVPPKDHTGQYIVQLVSDAKRNGFYHIRLPDKKEGWIYQSFVRGIPSAPGAATRAYKRTLYRL